MQIKTSFGNITLLDVILRYPAWQIHLIRDDRYVSLIAGLAKSRVFVFNIRRRWQRRRTTTLPVSQGMVNLIRRIHRNTVMHATALINRLTSDNRRPSARIMIVVIDCRAQNATVQRERGRRSCNQQILKNVYESFLAYE